MCRRGLSTPSALFFLSMLAPALAGAQPTAPEPVGPPPADKYEEPKPSSLDDMSPEPQNAPTSDGLGQAAEADSLTATEAPQPTGAPPAIAPAAAGTIDRDFTDGAITIVEPPIPGIYEPPPPPEPQHIAPSNALWVGARTGWFLPFGDVRAQCADAGCYHVNTIGWRRYASPGPLIELDAGARISRNYAFFLMWERAWLGAGSGPPEGQNGGTTDFFALAVRFSSDPDELGFLTEIAFGYRRARIDLGSNDTLRLDNAPFEARLGLGADIRINSTFSLSPLVSLGVGRFDDVVLIEQDGTKTDLLQDWEPISHASLTLQIGGHADLFGGS